MNNAIISLCKKYRYGLSRGTGMNMIDPRGTVFFVMLNPSTADSEKDDPTIRRCRGFADKWGFSGLVVGNLYAYRSTDHKQLWKVDDPVGPDNDNYIMDYAKKFSYVICAWGNHAKLDRVDQFKQMMKSIDVSLWHLGLNKSGSPKHPLYLKKDLTPIRW